MSYRIGNTGLCRTLYSENLTIFKLCNSTSSIKSLSTVSAGGELSGANAYDVLGVSETSSSEEIKTSFRKLAKETHPDVSVNSERFIQILAAYEILSDSEKRAHYDRYLFSQKKVVQKQHGRVYSMYTYESHVTTAKQMEVVEWLKWYRYAINDILSNKKVLTGTGYFDILESEFYSAMHAAYYGPLIESLDLLPDRFEAEERSAFETSEVLHLVSGRDLFGIVNVVDKFPELSNAYFDKLTSFTSMVSRTCQSLKCESMTMQARQHKDCVSEVYKDLELHICGKVVATATRIPPKSSSNGIQNEDSQDHIHVFLSSNEEPKAFSSNSILDSSVASRFLLGTITGLGTNPEEGSCFVYDKKGTKTHVIMKHRTLMVKHMHWFQVGDGVSACECRCSRARLPPSKFWLFEPRCGMHDIGGWYVETFGQDKKGRTILSQRHWDGLDAVEQPEKRLHPAMYLLALAYRTIDLEDEKIRKRTVRNIIEPKVFTILRWCKKLL